jgi:hypothetical protein
MRRVHDCDVAMPRQWFVLDRQTGCVVLLACLPRVSVKDFEGIADPL